MKIIITSQGATGSRTLAKALAKLSEKNAVVHGHFSVSSLYNDFNWKKKIDRSILFGSELKSLYSSMSIEQCFEYLKDVFDSEREFFISVHTFQIHSLVRRGLLDENKNIKIINLIRNPLDTLNSSLFLSENGFKNLKILNTEIKINFTKYLDSLNDRALSFIDNTSKHFGANLAMIMVACVYSIKQMLDDIKTAEKYKISNYSIEDLSTNELIIENFLKELNAPNNNTIEKNTINSFKQLMSINQNSHSNKKSHALLENSKRFFEIISGYNIEDYIKSEKKDNLKTDEITSDYKNNNHYKNLTIDFARENFDLKKIDKDVIKTIRDIINKIDDTVEYPKNDELIFAKRILLRTYNYVRVKDNIFKIPQDVGPVQIINVKDALEKYGSRGLEVISKKDLLTFLFQNKDFLKKILEKMQF